MGRKLKIKFFVILLIVAILGFAIIVILNKLEKTSYAYSLEIEDNTAEDEIEEIKISSAEEINLDNIIKENSVVSGYREEIIVENVELEYITKYRNNSELYIGETEVSQEGRSGLQAITTKRVYDENGELISEEQVSAVVIKSSINKIIDIGTKEYVEVDESTTNELSFDMALNIPSGFTLEQFKVALTDSKDVNDIFQDNAQYFYYIEDEYSINGIFVAAVGIHESGWGTSSIALNKMNLFGYGAYDSNPYNGAYSFESYSESIDLIARVFVKYYLNPSGTSIYDGETASGQYYSGNTLSAVNKKYASDTSWANNIYKYMKYLYNKII